ncbi:LacI family DNA-binding transcriptional regulator [Kitasatospora sp. NPDC057198]|uniref:LacI family DNA-binding transcriptional regulator n=1 Tax=Kitasatospora sp. NPDC057198 TaxID=3346046 RepID=UPI00362B5B99
MLDALPRPRLEDVAAAAGVSKSTASKVLGDAPGTRVGERTRTRIREAARRLGYRPHGPARLLATGRTGAVALVGPSLSDPDWAAAVGGATRRAALLGLAALVVEDAGDDPPAHGSAALVDPDLVDGVLVGPGAAGAAEALGFGRLPGVVLGEYGHPGWTDVPDRATEVARGAVDFLAGLGHRRLGLIGRPARRGGAGPDAFVRRCRELGLPEPVVTLQRADERGGADGLAELRRSRTAPSAVLTASFAQAVGVLGTAARLGLDVPGEVSVLAGGDCPAADHLVPTLSTLAVPSAELGAVAVGALAAVLSGADPRTAGRAAPAPMLTVRGSTGSSRAGSLSELALFL